MPQLPDFVAIGHICHDILPDGGLGFGGSVWYAATTAQRLGRRVAVVTSAGPGLDLNRALPGSEVLCQPAASTTVFENVYCQGRREQILHRRANTLTCEQIPAAWRQAAVVYLGSIDQEIDAGVFGCFAAESLIGVMPQGFFRQWDDAGRVSFVEWQPPASLLEQIDVLVISEQDVPDPAGLVHSWQRWVDIMVVTHAKQGATVYRAGAACHYPTRPARQQDPTGAGDVFTAAFLVHLSEGGDPCRAAAFASVMASFSVEGPGVSCIPSRQEVEAYLLANH